MITIQMSLLVLVLATAVAFAVVIAWPDDGHDPMSRL